MVLSNRGDSMNGLHFEYLKEEVEKVWWKLDNEYDNFVDKYSKEKDKELIKIKQFLSDYLGQMLKDGGAEPSTDEAMLRMKDFIVNTIGISQWSADTIFDEDYVQCSNDFIKRAKEMDETLGMEGVFQALRNVWTMNSMQIYLGKKLQLTDSVFAYSMLYPFTDNYLDDPNLTKEDKYKFNKRFREKIATGKAEAYTKQEEKIFYMIDLIEGEFDRAKNPKVFEALLAILDGQNMSLGQQHLNDMFNVDVLGISFYKGGSSVLADAYLVGGTLTEQEEKFAFYYGAILQLADDLQDIKEDLKNDHATVMNIQSRLGKIDRLIFKYFNLIEYFIANIYEERSDYQKALKEILISSIELLNFGALIRNKKYITRDLFNKVKMGSNFSPKAYNKVERGFNVQFQKLMDSY